MAIGLDQATIILVVSPIVADLQDISLKVVLAVHSFDESGFIPKGCNASFITLLPKKSCLVTLNDYRPISLVGCLYKKIIAKILANRLKKVIPNVIDKYQSAFLMKQLITLGRKS